MDLSRYLILLFFISLELFAVEKSRVFILHSYSQEYGWTKRQNKGFVETLDASARQFNYYTEYLDSKRVEQSDTYQEQFLHYLQNKYKESTPDVIYVTDDNALIFINKYRKELFNRDIPIFYSGVNNIEGAKKLPKEIYRGVYEIQGINQNIKLIEQFSPQTRDIYIIGDDSLTYHAIETNLRKE